MSPRRVLIVRTSHLGDIAQTLTLVHAVRRFVPDAELGWAIQPAFAPLVAPFARTFAFARDGGLAAWPKLRRELREWGPDVALDAQGNWKSATAVRASGAPSRFAFAREEWQEPLASRLCGFTFAAPGEPHLVARCRRLARTAFDASESDVSSLPIDPLLSNDERAAGERTLDELTRADAPILLHPGVEGDARSWPLERYAELAKRLDPARTVVVTGPAERTVGERLASLAPGAAHLVGQRGLRDLASIFAAAAGRGGVLVCGDSGPAHVAASVSSRVVLVAGPEDPERTGPWPIVTAPGSPHRAVPMPTGRASWSPRAIEDVTVADVEAALQGQTGI